MQSSFTFTCKLTIFLEVPSFLRLLKISQIIFPLELFSLTLKCIALQRKPMYLIRNLSNHLPFGLFPFILNVLHYRENRCINRGHLFLITWAMVLAMRIYQDFLPFAYFLILLKCLYSLNWASFYCSNAFLWLPLVTLMNLVTLLI